jgi:hypothetical protein
LEQRSRLDPQLLDQHVACIPVGGERVGLPAGSVEREHQHRVEALAQRFGGDERLELCDHTAVPALAEVMLDCELERRQPQLLEPADLGGRERLVGDIIERRAAPQFQRLARRAAGEQALEVLRVDRAGADAQLIALASRDDLRAVRARRERLAQLRHIHLDQLARRRRRLLAPQAVDQTRGRDRRSGVERQQRQQRARLAAAERDRAPVDACLHGSQDTDVHHTIAKADPTPAQGRPPNPRFTGLYVIYGRASTGSGDAPQRQVPASFGGLVGSHAASRAVTTTINDPRGALP